TAIHEDLREKDPEILSETPLTSSQFLWCMPLAAVQNKARSTGERWINMWLTSGQDQDAFARRVGLKNRTHVADIFKNRYFPPTDVVDNASEELGKAFDKEWDPLSPGLGPLPHEVLEQWVKSHVRPNSHQSPRMKVWIRKL